MEKYILQLLEELELIILTRWRRSPPHYFQMGVPEKYLTPPKGWDEKSSEHLIDRDSSLQTDMSIKEMEAWIEGDRERPMLYHFGLKSEQFPPASKLTDEQLEKLTNSVLHLWASFNYTAVIPDHAPARIIYPLLTERMLEPTTLLDFGHAGIEFCDYKPARCPFGLEYCTCKEDLDET